MEFKRFGDIVSIKKGKKIEQVEKENNTIRYIQIDDLRNDNNLKYCNKDDSYITVNEKDIVIAWDGANAGTVGYGLNGAIGSTLAKLEINDTEFNTIYCALFLRSKFYYLREKCTGATIPHLSRSSLEDLKLPKLNIDTQNKIVEILDKSQELIDKRKEQMELLEELIQSRFLEMFGNPVTNPKGWEVEKINTIAPIEQYKGEINDGKVWLLNLDMVESNSGRIINYNYVDKEEVGNSTCTFSTDNVLYSKLRPYLNKVAIPDREGYATSEMIPLKPNREILNREYFAYSLRSKAFVDYISEKVSGAKMPRVVMSDFKNFKLPIPPLELQEEFADFVEKVNDIKIVLNKSLEQLNNNFDSLISRAFKGELF